MNDGDENVSNIYSAFTDATEDYDSKNIDRSGWYAEFTEFDSQSDYIKKDQGVASNTVAAKQKDALLSDPTMNDIPSDNKKIKPSSAHLSKTNEIYKGEDINPSSWYDDFAEFDSLSDYGKKYEDVINHKGKGIPPLNKKSQGSLLSDIKDFVMSSFVDNRKAYKNSAEWVGPLDAHEVHERKIAHGFYYLSDHDNYTDEKDNPAVINEREDVGPPNKITADSVIYKDDTLSYWPSYNKLSPRCRGAYLDWLASKRNNTETPLGYVFIYFSGIEYRVINDNSKIKNSEYIAIYQEVIRLFSIYGSNFSFSKYSSNFINYLRILRAPLIEAYDKQYPIKDVKIRNKLSPSIEIRVARNIANNEPISASLAWLWLRKCGGYSFNTPYKRLAKEFRTLFCLTYNQEHPSGIEVRNNGSSLHMVYEPSNFAVDRVMFPFKDLPNPSTFVIQMRKLTGIAERTSKQLDPVSRYLGKNGSSKEDFDAIIMMPRPIIEQIANEDGTLVNTIKKWAEITIKSGDGLTSTESLWQALDQPLDPAVTFTNKENRDFQKDGRSLVLLFDALGFGVAPDKRYHKEEINRFDPIVIFKGAHCDDFVYSTEYDDAKSVISLAAAIAKSNNAKSEENAIQVIDTYKTAKAIMATIEKNIEIEDSQKPSLYAYALWRLTNNNHLIKLSPKNDHFQVIGNETATSDLIIAAGFSDNIFNKHRIAKAEKVYAYLGSSKSALPSLIHRLQTTGSATGDERKGSGLDFDKLKQYESETRSSANILNNVFAAEGNAFDNTQLLTEENTQIDATPDMPASNYSSLINNEVIPTTESEKETILAVDIASTETSEGFIIDGLDAVHSNLYSQLVKKDGWSTADVEQLCQSLGLMLSGAIETINDWSFDNIDAAVVEEDDDEIVIDHDSVEELKNLN